MEGKPASEIRYAFVGGGIIAAVFIERLITSGAAGADRIVATDNRAERLSALKDRFGITVSANNADAGGFADVVFIAVPPPAVPGVLNELRPCLQPDALVISLAAAVPIALMKSAAGEGVTVVRVIPNTPSQIGCGINPFCCDPMMSDSQRTKAITVLSVFGQALEIPEHLMNAATALTAVGPTYILPLLSALKREAVQQGISESDAHIAVAQMVLGTARLMLDTGREPDDLKLMIGTRTIAEDAANSVVVDAYRKAVEKVNEADRKVAQLAASGGSH